MFVRLNDGNMMPYSRRERVIKTCPVETHQSARASDWTTRQTRIAGSRTLRYSNSVITVCPELRHDFATVVQQCSKIEELMTLRYSVQFS